MVPHFVKAAILDYIAFYKGIGGCSVSEIYNYINALYPNIVNKSQVRSFLNYYSNLKGSQLQKKTFNSIRKVVIFSLL